MRDMIYRDDAIRVANGYCHPSNIAKELERLPSAQLKSEERTAESAQNIPNCELISKKAAIDAMCKLMHHWFGGDPKDEIREIKRELEQLPPAQPERKTGRWERHYSRPNVYADLWWHCSSCGYKNDDQYANHYHHYCPYCGAKMEVEHD